MPDFGNRNGESLDAIARTDQLLDALADQGRLRPADRGEADLFALLEDWRDQVRTPSPRTLITEQEAADALRDGLAAAPQQKGGSRRGLALVSSLAAAVLAIGGFGAVVAGAGPNDALYGLRSTLFGEPRSVRDDNVALAAQTEMAEVQRLIERGDWEQAQAKLVQVSTSVQTVDDESRKQALVDEWNRLNVKVEKRDPNATVPAPVPEEITTPGPMELTQLPSEATTTSGSAPTSETSGSSVTTSPSESPATTSATAPTTSPAPTTTAPSTGPATTSAVVTTTPAATATSSAPPTSAPSTTTTTTTSSAPAAQSAPSPSSAASSVSSAPRSEASASVPPSPVPAAPTIVSVPNVVIPNVPDAVVPAAPNIPIVPNVPSALPTVVVPAVPAPFIQVPVPGSN